MMPSLCWANRAATVFFLYLGCALHPVHATILDFSGNPSGPAWMKIWSGDYWLRAGNETSHGDTTFVIGSDAVTVVPGASAAEIVGLARGELDRFYLQSLDVAMKWTGDPALQPADFSELSVFLIGTEETLTRGYHVDGWDAYTHIVFDVPMELVFAGFRSPNPLTAIRFANINVVDGRLAAPIPEPSTYAMMIAGLGLIGFVGWRRRDTDLGEIRT